MKWHRTNWGKQGFQSIPPAVDTEWEKLLKQKGLDKRRPELAALDPEVKEWIMENYRRYYVPPKALRKLGISELIL